jgi:hypothetical protein
MLVLQGGALPISRRLELHKPTSGLNSAQEDNSRPKVGRTAHGYGAILEETGNVILVDARRYVVYRDALM